jgi:hypothetical protein
MHKPRKKYYTQQFYGSIGKGSLMSARKIVPILLENINPIRSVIDLGCGMGLWLSVFKEMGVETIRGVDGDYVDTTQLSINASDFITHDFNMPFADPEGKRYDLAVSIEVAEHLPESCARRFVDSLCGLSDFVLLSAAIKGQGGINHINEQPVSYWADMFKQNGYIALDCIRPRVLGDGEAARYCKTNMMLYIKNSPENKDIILAITAGNTLIEMDICNNAYISFIKDFKRRARYHKIFGYKMGNKLSNYGYVYDVYGLKGWWKKLIGKDWAKA